MMVPDDSLRGYILECDLGNYYFYYLYIHVHFIKHNVSFLYISENLRDFIKCNFSFLCISKYPRDLIKCNASFLCILEYPHELHDVQKGYPLAPERLQVEENVTCSSTLLKKIHKGIMRTCWL